MFEKPEQVLAAWIEAVNAGDLDRAVGLYRADAVLLPTFSNKRPSDTAAIRAYFEQLARHDQLSVELHPRTLQVNRLSGSLYSLTGIYLWRFDIDGEVLNFEARFTFTVDVALDTPIIHQHSSQVPRML